MQKLPILTTIVICTIIMAACADKPTDVVDSSPRVTFLTPTSAKYFDTVSIYGENFGTKSDSIIVLLDGSSISPILISDTCIKFVIPSSVGQGKKSVSVKLPKIEIKNLAVLEVLAPQWGDFSTVILSFRLHGDSTFKLTTSSYPYTDTTVKRTVSFGTTMGSNKLPATYSNGKINYNYEYLDGRFIPDVGSNPKVGGKRYLDRYNFIASIDTFSKTIYNVYISEQHSESYSAPTSPPWSFKRGLEYNLGVGTYVEIENGIEIVYSGEELNILPQNIVKYYTEGGGPGVEEWNFSKAPPYASDNFIKVKLLRLK